MSRGEAWRAARKVLVCGFRASFVLRLGYGMFCRSPRFALRAGPCRTPQRMVAAVVGGWCHVFSASPASPELLSD